MDPARDDILRRYGVSPVARLSGGMEAEVYALGQDAVLKLYAGTAVLTDLLTLRDFYDSLDAQPLPYALPQIDAVVEEDGFMVTIERRLAGEPMSARLPALSTAELDTMLQRYLEAALAVADLQPMFASERYKLFDPERLSQRADGDWHQFLQRYLADKLVRVQPYLSRDVAQFATRVECMRTILAQPYRGRECLIHGDFFPGNLLIDEAGQITALLDFGLMTMWGDPLFDLATGWVFFDMYDELGAHIRERYLALLLDRLGGSLRGVLYRYVLFYSIVAANAYSPTCSDGHYRWCVANLNQQHYWQEIE